MQHYGGSSKGIDSFNRAPSRLILWLSRVTDELGALEISAERLFQWLRREWRSIQGRESVGSLESEFEAVPWSKLCEEMTKLLNKKNTSVSCIVDSHSMPKIMQVDAASLRKKISRIRKNERPLHGWEFAEMLGYDESAADCDVAAFVNQFSSLQKQAKEIGFSPEEIEAMFARLPTYLEAVSRRFHSFESEQRIPLD